MLNMNSPSVQHTMGQAYGGCEQHPPYFPIGYNGYNGQNGFNPGSYVYVNGSKQYVTPPDPYAQPDSAYEYGNNIYDPAMYQMSAPINPYDGFSTANAYGYRGFNPYQNMYTMGHTTNNPYVYNPNQPSMNYFGQAGGFGYINPIARQEAERKQRELMEQQRIGMMNYYKKLSKAAHAYIGEHISDEELDTMYNPVDTRTPKEIEEEMEFNRTARIVQYGRRVCDEVDYNKVVMFNNVKTNHDKFIDPNAGLIEFLNQAGGLYVDGLMRDARIEERKVSKTYDRKAYMTRLFNGVLPERVARDLDDDVIHLPKYINGVSTDTYAERRKRFMDSIFRQKPQII